MACGCHKLRPRAISCKVNKCSIENDALFLTNYHKDEVFHIPQGQAYCKGNYHKWDDKITTPPGLYALTILFNRAQGVSSCRPEELRKFNVFAIALLALLAQECRSAIEYSNATFRKRELSQSWYSIHTAFNISLLPILFFFSGLYYTDIISALMVLASYRIHLGRKASISAGSNPTVANGMVFVALGVVSLAMRQTNIFWIVVLMGGLEVVEAVKSITPEPPTKIHTGAGSMKQRIQGYVQCYANGDIHDPPINLAWPDDIIVSLVSIAIAAIFNLSKVFRQIWPHLSLLFAFALFVAWNGGVVLGDKSNHIATLHIAQMIYLWPLFLFFSIPLCLPFGSHFLGWLMTIWNSLNKQEQQTNHRQFAQESNNIKKRDAAMRCIHPKTEIPGLGIPVLDTMLLRKSYMPGFFTVGWLAIVAVVKFNTIIHPFTLADNRHYMFYVFRYTIRKAWWVRYVLLVPYWISLVNVIRCLQGCQSIYASHSKECPVRRQIDLEYLNSPFIDSGLRVRRKKTTASDLFQEGNIKNKKDTMTFFGSATPETTPPTSSTFTLWLLATTLSVITAPLVEPRYFILPWIFWRLHVPAWRLHDCSKERPLTNISEKYLGHKSLLIELGKAVDLRLFLESAWYILINISTMVIFIMKPFYWYDENGNISDNGSVQRFMW